MRNQICKNLLAATRVSIDDESLERAAVVIAVLDEAGQCNCPCFLLTRRASKMRKHAGQFALPGGKVDQGESIEQAALRELHEELGIEVGNHEVLGMLDDYPTRSGFCITPVVVWIESAATLKLNSDEVATVFYIPLEELQGDALVNLESGESPEKPVFSINLATIGHEIYAPTAAIIYQFYEMAMRGNETRVSFYDEPKFAWR